MNLQRYLFFLVFLLAATHLGAENSTAPTHQLIACKFGYNIVHKDNEEPIETETRDPNIIKLAFTIPQTSDAFIKPDDLSLFDPENLLKNKKIEIITLPNEKESSIKIKTESSQSEIVFFLGLNFKFSPISDKSWTGSISSVQLPYNREISSLLGTCISLESFNPAQSLNIVRLNYEKNKQKSSKR